MTFVSYAQNFEDVLLWRALRGVANGFYIDVGAAHPDIDSVTRAFYDRGWSGINIEPTAEFSMRLAASRARDINLQMALGEQPGRAELFVIAGTGLSTIERTAVDLLREAGMDLRAAEVAVDTLANVCRGYAPDDIHFLKIDVEGAERGVLAGGDFRAFRPWIVIVEATAPMSKAETYGAWESILLEAEYTFVWFDGLNRYYVAAERHSDLAHAFQTPPNVFDDFVRAADSEWARRIHEAESQVALLRDRLGPAETRATNMFERAVAAEERARYEALGAARDRLRNEELTRDGGRLRAALEGETWRRMKAETEAAREKHHAAEAELRAVAEAQHATYEMQRSAINEMRQLEAVAAFEAMRRSTSWRVTAPLRRLRSNKSAIGPTITQGAPPAREERHSATPTTVTSAKASPSPITAPYRTAVHQFHSGAASGDAITNSMLLTRARLRALGYRSDIFVIIREPALADDLRLADELPRHEHYVLILRHSMGFDFFDDVVSVPAPKILLYHNITPPELLEGDEFMQRYAMKGRTQLRELRRRVCASLADSEYNAMELRALGFPAVQVCNTLFDVETLLARASATPKAKDPSRFTIIFVGRVVRSKGQAELLDVFATFRSRFAKPCRLVLVGRHADPDDVYLRSIMARIEAYGMAEDVLLTGAVSDSALHDWYARADLYVSLSRHEGFGVPLIEAMAHDVPVLARPAAAVPYTLRGTGGLLNDETLEGVVARLLDLAQHPEQREALIAAQRSAIDRVRWDGQRGALLHALGTAGAVPPVQPEARDLLTASIRFTVAGHVNGSYSLSAINRTLALALEIARPGDVRLRPVEGEFTNTLDAVPAAERAEIEALVTRPKPLEGPLVVISQHYPVYVPADMGDLPLAYFFWEESVVPFETIACLNASFRGVLAPSRFVAKALIDSGLSVPVRIVGFAPRLEAFRALARRPPPAAPRPFTFLHVSSGFPRKGVDALLTAYTRAFRRNDPVRLVIKVFPNPLNTVSQQIAALQTEERDAPEIVLIDRDLDDVEVLDLYRDANAMVLPTRGEGFNLPAAEALAAGLPLIVTGYSGHMDFCENPVRFLDYSFAPSGSHLAEAGSLWVDPDVEDLARALAEAVRNEAPVVMPARLPDARSFAEGIVKASVELLLLRPLPPLRIGWISSWGVRCGIAEYSRHLLQAMLEAESADDGGDDPEGSQVKAPSDRSEITLLCDTRTDADLPDDVHATVSPCWLLGLLDGAAPLVRAVGAADPDVLVIQHQPGLMAWEALTELLMSAAVRARPVVLVLHTTGRILDIPEKERAPLLAAFGGVTRIVVHTIHDTNRLKAFGLVSNVSMIPQGAVGLSGPLPVVAPPAERGARQRAPLIGCYGFFFKDKGVLPLIEAVARLRTRFPDIRLRLVNADYGSPDSAEEIARCRASAAAAGFAEAVEWHTDFLPDDESRKLLGGCDLIVLPYQVSKEGSSAALRMAMSSGVPVAVTPLPLFDEAERAVFRFRGTSVGDIEDGVALLLDEPERRQEVLAEMRLWLGMRTWPAIAARFGGMLKGLRLDAKPQGAEAPDEHRHEGPRLRVDA